MLSSGLLHAQNIFIYKVLRRTGNNFYTKVYVITIDRIAVLTNTCTCLSYMHENNYHMPAQSIRNQYLYKVYIIIMK